MQTAMGGVLLPSLLKCTFESSGQRGTRAPPCASVAHVRYCDVDVIRFRTEHETDLERGCSQVAINHSIHSRHLLLFSSCWWMRISYFDWMQRGPVGGLLFRIGCFGAHAYGGAYEWRSHGLWDVGIWRCYPFRLSSCAAPSIYYSYREYFRIINNVL